METYIRAGTYARKPTLPYTPGTDVAGVVETVGEGVTAVKVGVKNSGMACTVIQNEYIVDSFSSAYKTKWHPGQFLLKHSKNSFWILD